MKKNIENQNVNNKSLSVLLVGCGYIGKVHASSAAGVPQITYVGVVDINPAASISLAEELHVPKYAELERAIIELQPDVVDICVPTYAHLNVVEVCARHGIAILLEKPIALCIEEAFEIKRIVERSEIPFMVAHVTRFWAEYEYAVDLARSKTYGEILNVELKRLSPLPAFNEWMLDKDKGGGAAIDLQIHDLDFLQQLLGVPTIISAVGREYRGAFNGMISRFNFDSGALATVETSFLMPDTFPFTMEYRIDFEFATVVMSSSRPMGQHLVIYPVQGETQIVDLEGWDPFAKQWRYFAEAVSERRRPDRVPVDDAIAALALCLSTVNSARERIGTAER